MNVEQGETQPHRTITWRTQITLHPQRGLLTRATVERATTGVTDASTTLDIVIAGRLDVVDSDAAMPLGYLLHRADEVNVTAHGRGVPHLFAAIQHAIRHEQDFRADLHAAQRRRERTSPYDPWQPIGDKA